MEQPLSDSTAKGRTTRRTRSTGADAPRSDNVEPEAVVDAEAQPASQETEPASQETIDPDARERMIREAAYARYVGRGYANGYDVEDWLAAETDVDEQLRGRRMENARRA